MPLPHHVAERISKRKIQEPKEPEKPKKLAYHQVTDKNSQEITEKTPKDFIKGVKKNKKERLAKTEIRHALPSKPDVVSDDSSIHQVTETTVSPGPEEGTYKMVLKTVTTCTSIHTEEEMEDILKYWNKARNPGNTGGME